MCFGTRYLFSLGLVSLLRDLEQNTGFEIFRVAELFYQRQKKKKKNPIYKTEKST